MFKRITHNAQRTTGMIGFFMLGLSLCGCATLADLPKGIAGISTRVLEENRGSALTKTFQYNYTASFDKAKEAIIKIGGYIYAQNFKKRLIAFYVSKTDTTPVGVFFKEIDPGNTGVEVSSPSATAKEHSAKRIFAVLAGLPDPEAKQKGAKDEGGFSIK